MDQARLREFEYRCIQEEPAECVAACPLHVDARSFVVEVAAGEWAAAWKVLRKTMPLPSVLGLICDHPCELRCKRRECGEAIRIGALERACVQTPPPAQRVLPLPRRDTRVAVVGSGLAGLTVAWDLARKGYPVTVFDPGERVGGLLLEFSDDVLPLAALDSEVAVLEKMGVGFRLGEPVDLAALERDFDAVFWGLDGGLNWLEAGEPGAGGLAGPEAGDSSGASGSGTEGLGPASASKPPASDLGPDGASGLGFDPATMLTERPKVFMGGGSSAGGTGSPIQWALDGRRAAVSIDRLLQGASLTAGREKEGPQPTRLFVSLAGVEPSLAVVAAAGASGEDAAGGASGPGTDGGAGGAGGVGIHGAAGGHASDEAQREADRCLRCECLECVKVCEYLRQFGGYPRRHAREIYNNACIVQGEHKANLLINSCMLCDLCTAVCPEDFSMPDLCLGARWEMLEKGKMPPSAHEFALEDYRWSHGAAFALARNQSGSESSTYAFFPGCQLAGSNPGQVERAYEYLCSSLPGGVGLILDCCGAPAYWAGREDLFEQGVADIAASWEELGRPILVLACPTCLALLEPRLPEAECRFLSDVLAEAGASVASSMEGQREVRALHDPCTTRHNPSVQSSVRGLLALLGQPVEELALSGETTECCGYGGLEANANPKLARAVAARRGAESTREFLTYCAMCRDNLAAVGKRSIHILDLLFPEEDDPAGRARPGWSERRENRARLKERLLSTLWAEGGGEVEPWQAIELYLSEEVKTRLDARRILIEDVQRVVQNAEETGQKLCHGVTGRFLASYRPRAVTFWVEYSPRGSGFEIHNAYGHRMTLQAEAS